MALDAPPPPIGGTARASDGDSLRLGDSRVRLVGLDAPELAQTCRDAAGRDWPCGRSARDRLAQLLSTGAADCRPEGKDQYDRLLARCFVSGRDVGEVLVAEGLAVAYGDYWVQEASARSQALGIWEGGFEAPRAWRQDHPRPQGLRGLLAGLGW